MDQLTEGSLDSILHDPASGVVASARYENGKRLSDVSIQQCGAAAREAGRVLWLGLYEPPEETLRIIQEQLGLHELLIEDAHQAHQRPKLDVYGDVLFIVLRTAQLIDGKIDYGETHLVVGKGFIVSIRHGASASYAGVRRESEGSADFCRMGESYALYAILVFIADNYFPIIDKISEELSRIEDLIFSGAPRNEDIERVYRLRSGLLHMRNAISPMIEICNRLIRHEFRATAGDDIAPYLHDVHDHVLQVNESIIDLRERLAAAFEASLLLASARQNDVVKKLASWAAILAVPTAVAGIYGMNFKNMPELDWPWGYPASLLLMLSICCLLYYRFRRVNWI